MNVECTLTHTFPLHRCRTSKAAAHSHEGSAFLLSQSYAANPAKPVLLVHAKSCGSAKISKRSDYAKWSAEPCDIKAISKRPIMQIALVCRDMPYKGLKQQHYCGSRCENTGPLLSVDSTRGLHVQPVHVRLRNGLLFSSPMHGTQASIGSYSSSVTRLISGMLKVSPFC